MYSLIHQSDMPDDLKQFVGEACTNCQQIRVPDEGSFVVN
jgi:hypothetical protein